MKHISRRLTAISAAAITAVSALSATGLTAHAFHFTAQTDLNHLDIDAQAWADFENYLKEMTELYKKKYEGKVSFPAGTIRGAVCHSVSSEMYQSLLPEFSKSDLSTANKYNITIDRKTNTSFGNNTTFFCTFEDNAAKPNYIDKLTVQTKTKSGMNHFGLLIEACNAGNANLNHYAARLYDDYYMKNYYLNKLKLKAFEMDSTSGEYHGTFRLDSYYAAGLRLSSNDGYTTFKTPVLKKDSNGIYTEIEFKGDIKFATDGSLYFAGDKTCNLLANLKITYNGCQTPIVTNAFKKTYTKNNNKTYTGLLYSTDDQLLKKLDVGGSLLRNFNKDNFTGVITSGDKLIICIGAGSAGISNPNWENGNGDVKMKALLSCGYRDFFKYNKWLQNNMDSYSRIYFHWNATDTYNGKDFANYTPAQFRKLLSTY